MIGTNFHLIQHLGRLTADSTFKIDYSSTVGSDFGLKTVKIRSTEVKLKIYIVSRAKYKALRSMYYQGAHGCLIFYDKGDLDSFKKVEELCHEFQEIQGKLVPIGLVAVNGNNKSISSEEGQQLAKTLNLHYFECPLSDLSQMDLIFTRLTELILTQD